MMQRYFIKFAVPFLAAFFLSSCADNLENGSSLNVNFSVPYSIQKTSIQNSFSRNAVFGTEYEYSLSANPVQSESQKIERNGKITAGSSTLIQIDEVEAGKTYKIALVLSKDGKEIAKGESGAVFVDFNRPTVAEIKMKIENSNDSSSDEESYSKIIQIPVAANTASVSTFEELNAAISSAQSSSGITKITLNEDIALSSSVSYHNENESPLIIDLNGKTLSISDSISGYAITALTSVYVENGEISSSQSDSDFFVFKNSSSLFLSELEFDCGASGIVEQQKEDGVNGGNPGMLIMDGCKIESENNSYLLFLDGLSILNRSSISCGSPIGNSGTLVLAGGTEIEVKSDGGFENEGLTVLVGATVRGTITNPGTLAILDSYSKDDWTFSASQNSVGSVYNKGNGSSLILGKSALIEDKIINEGKIYAVSAEFSNKPVAKISSGNSLSSNFGGARVAESGIPACVSLTDSQIADYFSVAE